MSFEEKLLYPEFILRENIVLMRYFTAKLSTNTQ